MIPKSDTARQFVRAAKNASRAYENIQKAKAVKEDLPNQLKKLQAQLKEAMESKYPDKALIKRIEGAITIKQQQISRYLGSAKE
ncbi:MAG: hypothetical protein IKZ34_01220 [Alphaproteobacteria bacterium]|jgi:hypothetical protein|nr:hypothetical protein [Alphaproteobacteria bacterium]